MQWTQLAQNTVRWLAVVNTYRALGLHRKRKSLYQLNDFQFLKDSAPYG
jgi:hypothetical protein